MLKVARAPLQTPVLPFRRKNGKLEFTIFRRADDGSWQSIAGGGDEGETPIQAAKREAQEEASIPLSSPLYPLQATSTVPVVCVDVDLRKQLAR